MSRCTHCDRPAAHGWSGVIAGHPTCVMCAITRAPRATADPALIAALARGDTTIRAAARARGIPPAELKTRLYGSRESLSPQEHPQ